MFLCIALAVSIAILLFLMPAVRLKASEDIASDTLLTEKEARLISFNAKISIAGITVYDTVIAVRIRNLVRLELYEIKNGTARKIMPVKKRKKETFFTHILKKALLRSLRIKKLGLNIRIGTGNAAATALSCGALGVIIDALIALSQGRVPHEKIIITPDFDKAHLKLNIDCIIRTRIADIIREVIKQLMKGGKKNASIGKHIESVDV